MADVELLPLPEPEMLHVGGSSGWFTADQMRAYARANMEPLISENERLKEALEMMVEMVEMNGFGKAAAMDTARAALAQEDRNG